VVYHYSNYRYLGDPQAFSDHSVQLAYGRKLTGRLGLQLFGGPEITVFRVPLGNETQRVGGAGGVGIAYAFSQGDLGLSYSHGVSGGSGLLVDRVRIRFRFRQHGSWRDGTAARPALASPGTSRWNRVIP